MLLLATDRLCAANAGWKRLLAGAAVGAAYSALCVIFGGFLQSVILRLCCAALMVLITFGKREKLWRFAAVFALSSAVFAGIVLAVSLFCGGFGARQMAVSFALAYALLGIILRFSAAQGGKARLTIHNRGRSVTLTALRDTGNSLRDPISGAPAIIAREEELLPLLEAELCAELEKTSGLPSEQRLERLWQSGRGSGFKLLPYSAVGVQSGFLLAFKVDKVNIGGREIKNALAAIAPNELSAGGEFSAIINGNI